MIENVDCCNSRTIFEHVEHVAMLASRSLKTHRFEFLEVWATKHNMCGATFDMLTFRSTCQTCENKV